MKKLLSLLGVFIFIGCLQSYASKREIYMDFYKSGHVDKNTTVHRSPMRIPIDVYYDEELRLIEISGNEDMSIQIYLCDENGNTVNCSPSINTILEVPCGYSGLISIRIESEGWIATGKMII